MRVKTSLFLVVLTFLVSECSAKKKKLFSFSLSEDPVHNSLYGKLKSERLGIISNFILFNNESNIYRGQVNIIQPTPWTLSAKANVIPETSDFFKVELHLNSTEPNSLIAASNLTLKLIPEEGYDLAGNMSFAINQSVSGSYNLNVSRSKSCPYVCLNHSLVTDPLDAIQFTSFVNQSELLEAGSTISKMMIGIDLKSTLWPAINTNLLQLFAFGPGYGYESMNATNSKWDASITADWTDYPKKRHHKSLTFTHKTGEIPSFSLTYQNEDDRSISLRYTELDNGFCDLTKNKCE